MHTRVVDKLCKACIISHAQLIHHTYAKSGMMMIFRNAISKVGKCAAKAAGKEEGKKKISKDHWSYEGRVWILLLKTRFLYLAWPNLILKKKIGLDYHYYFKNKLSVGDLMSHTKA